MFTYVCTYIYIYVYTHINMYIDMYIYIYVCMYYRFICIYIYMIPTPKDLLFLAFCRCRSGSMCWEPFAKTK